MEIKDLIRTNRLKNNYTMMQLAQLLGCKQSTITAWESGENTPGPKYLFKLSELFGINMDVSSYNNDNNDNNNVINEPAPVYEKVSTIDKLVDNISIMARNNEKLVSTNEILTLKLMALIEKINL